MSANWCVWSKKVLALLLDRIEGSGARLVCFQQRSLDVMVAAGGNSDAACFTVYPASSFSPGAAEHREEHPRYRQFHADAN